MSKYGIGQPVLRFEDPRLLRGHGNFVNDVNLAGLKITRANLTGASIASSRMDGMTIDGVDVNEMLAFWRAGHGTEKQ